MIDGRPAIAVTSGEPAGIGPELCAMLAVRHEREPFASRLVILGDRGLLDHVQIRSASLEDVFLALTGREYRA